MENNVENNVNVEETAAPATDKAMELVNKQDS